MHRDTGQALVFIFGNSLYLRRLNLALLYLQKVRLDEGFWAIFHTMSLEGDPQKDIFFLAKLLSQK